MPEPPRSRPAGCCGPYSSELRERHSVTQRRRPGALLIALVSPLFAAFPSLSAVTISAPSPVDGMTVGPRPVFRFTVRGTVDADARAVIELSRDRWKTVERTWDATASQRGREPRLYAEGSGGVFPAPEALPEGSWEWRVRLSQDGAPPESAKAGSFKVDATPPAEIEGLRVQRRPDDSILLSWEAVESDMDGRPETIDHYAIYKYDSRGTFPQAPLARLGQTQSLSFLDRGSGSEGRRRPAAVGSGDVRGKAASSSEDSRSGTGEPPDETTGAAGKHASGWKRSGTTHAVYYKVVAVDVAGNELGVRELAPPADLPSVQPTRPQGGRKEPRPQPDGSGNPQERP